MPARAWLGRAPSWLRRLMIGSSCIRFGAGHGPFPVNQIRSCRLALGHLPLRVGSLFPTRKHLRNPLPEKPRHPLQLTFPVHSVLVTRLPASCCLNGAGFGSCIDLGTSRHLPRLESLTSLQRRPPHLLSALGPPGLSPPLVLLWPHAGSTCHPRAGIPAALPWHGWPRLASCPSWGLIEVGGVARNSCPF